MTCPSCQRPVAVARERCLYCGAALPHVPQAQAPPSPPVPTAAAREERALLVVDFAGADPTAVARALQLSPFDAAQRVRRGGLQLWRLAGTAEVVAEAEAIAAAGLAVMTLPEAEVRTAARPLVALGGRFADGMLDARVEGGRLRIARPDLLLVVRGPIARNYPTAPDLKRLRTATLETGYRIHLHRRADPQPLELDPGSFEFSEPALASRSSLLELLEWLETLAQGLPIDNDFRLLMPALGVAAQGSGSVGALVDTLTQRQGRSRDPATLILDNVEQFRFYSAWRAAMARRRTRPAG